MLTHGLSKHPIYRLWYQMKKRCYNQSDISFKWYGAKGIVICEEWHIFKPFYDWCIENGWGNGLTIDRKDNLKNYSPDNCAFICRLDNSKKRHQDSPVNHKGHKNPNAKLTLELIDRLKNDLINNNISTKNLSNIYKISRTQIYRIKNGLGWNSISL